MYHSQTAPLIEWYKTENIHNHIDGLGELERIFADVCAVIDNIETAHARIKLRRLRIDLLPLW